jgi:thiamine kinase-like enzyme
MNKILQLFDEQYVKELFTENVLPLYPDFSVIKKIKIVPHKKHVWDHTYHVVIEFETTFLTRDKKRKTLPIFCTAHSEEPRKNAYAALKFLWDHSFSTGYLSMPRALFYSEYFQGAFYRGVEGRNLYQFIRKGDLKEIENIIPRAAAWFAKLHNLDTAEASNFNSENSRIKTVYPGVLHILKRIDQDYPEYHAVYEEIYKILIQREEAFFSSMQKRWLVHGDAHPENIIKMSQKKTAVIDFTDLCLSDFTRDLGSFTQQLEFMIKRKLNDTAYAEKMKELFLESYFKLSKKKLTEDVRKRINNYYCWTAMRTATFFLIKDKAEPQRSFPLINQVCGELGVKKY